MQNYNIVLKKSETTIADEKNIDIERVKKLLKKHFVKFEREMFLEAIVSTLLEHGKTCCRCGSLKEAPYYCIEKV